ncbi:AMP-binding protein [Mariprofundus sp. NF]|uniref:AMP-binding protein n=1 Tax=Mariprofundus sp. NF TaxID=2608716 RepID=UPI00159F78EC|nr:AMP-binding protein [Mariprofundus sp. NF]NWF39538.1 AMP-binding protein [Mariprofundus sp. NF]
MTTQKKNYTGALYRDIKVRAKNNTLFADFNDEKLTYRQLLNSVQKLTSFFRTHELKQDSRIIIVTKHDKHAITILTAALLEGFSPILLSVEAKSKRLQAIAEKVSPQMIFVDDELQPALPWLAEFLSVSILEESNRSLFAQLFGKKNRSVECYPSLLTDYGISEPACAARADDIAFISFTSGTTSEPKGILTTHANLFEHLETLTRVFGYTEQSRIFNNLSLAHNDGFVQGPLLALFSGALLYRPPAFTIQNLEERLNSLFSKRITHFITVPTILSLIDRLTSNNDYFEGEDFRCLISVAAKLDANLWERSQQRFGINICNIYGLSETVAGGLFCGPDKDSFALGTVGKPVDMDIRIVDEKGCDCSVNEEGELWLKGENVTPGYLDDPIATTSLFFNDWLCTGDMARQNPEGFIEIVGRKKAIIMSGGFNIHPDEINEVLMSHPQVADSATVGIADQDWGELVVSVVESDDDLDEANLIDHCRHFLEPIKVPKTIVTTNRLPRGVSGKVLLSEIRDLITDTIHKSDRNNTTIPHSDIVGLAASVFNASEKKLSLNSSSDQTPGWDSLGHLNLITATEQRYDIQFSMDEMMRVDSLQCLLEMVQNKLKCDES